MSVFPIDGPASVRVDIQMGRVEVIASARQDVVVTVAPSNPQRSGDRNASDAVRVERIGSDVVVKGPYRLSILGPGDSVDVVVEVPSGSTISSVVKYGSARLSGSFAAVRAELPYGEFTLDAAERLEIKGGHGEFRITDVAGDAEIGFKSGSARIGRIGGRLHLNGADGRIEVDVVDGPAEIATSSGAIEVGTAASGLAIRAAYGAVTIRDAVRGAIRIDGSYGNVEVGVRQGTAVWLDATSQHGAVRTDLAADSGPVEGDETLELRIRTGYGRIDVHRTLRGADPAA